MKQNKATTGSIMKKMLTVFILGFLLSSGANAHTSISFSVNQGGMPGMMNDYDYEDMLWMQQLQARRMQNRLMRMQMAQMGYAQPMYRGYYSYSEPYFVRTRTVYTQQYVRHPKQPRCHKRAC